MIFNSPLCSCRRQYRPAPIVARPREPLRRHCDCDHNATVSSDVKTKDPKHKLHLRPAIIAFVLLLIIDALFTILPKTLVNQNVLPLGFTKNIGKPFCFKLLILLKLSEYTITIFKFITPCKFSGQKT